LLHTSFFGSDLPQPENPSSGALEFWNLSIHDDKSGRGPTPEPPNRSPHEHPGCGDRRHSSGRNACTQEKFEWEILEEIKTKKYPIIFVTNCF
jgi:hypothetical protein